MMATANKTTNESQGTPPVMVTVKIPLNRNGGDNSDVFVSVNGKNYLIKRGIDVQVPEYVAEVLRNSDAAQDAAYSYAKDIEFEMPQL